MSDVPSGNLGKAQLHEIVRDPKRYVHSIREEVTGVIIFLGVIWACYILSCFFPLNDLGLIPRTVRGIPGIVMAPFLHESWGHLLGNTFSLFILLTLLAGSRARSPYIVASLIVTSGVLLWLFGRNGTPEAPRAHVGASGLVYALITFHICAGIFERRLISIAISILVGLFYGLTLLKGVNPLTQHPAISWDGHLMGAIAGVLVAAAWTMPAYLNRQRKAP